MRTPDIAKIEALVVDRYTPKSLRPPLEREVQRFIANANRYIKASQQGRLMANVISVAKSGVSRKVKLFELDKAKYTPTHHVYTFGGMLVRLGHEVEDYDTERVHSVGDAHERIIFELYDLGFLTEYMRDKLAKQSPHQV